MQDVIAGTLRLQLDFLVANRDLAFGATVSGYMRRRSPRIASPRPVITMPGFAAPARSHAPLSRFLEHCGFAVETVDPGFPSQGTIREFVHGLRDTLGVRIQRLADRYGAPVALVGQSAGGLYAREYAGLFPADVDRVVTLGSPTADPARATQPNRALELIVKRISGAAGFDSLSGSDGLKHWPATRPELPYIAICSPLDGAVAEREALIPRRTVDTCSPEAPRENLRVRCSHFGMCFNPFVMLAVADRLAQPTRPWTDFDPRPYFPRWPRSALRQLYPSPHEAGIAD